FRARREFGLVTGLCVFVPRTHRETIVTAIDAIAHERTQLARDRTLVLDGEIGNAAPRIEPVGGRERRGRTDIQTGMAGAAMIFAGRVGRKFERGEDRAEKQPRSVLA